MTNGNKSVVEFDEIFSEGVSGDKGGSKDVKLGQTRSPEPVSRDETSMPWSGGIPSFTGKLWSFGSKRSKWLTPILLIVGLLLGLIFLLLLVVIGIPFLLLRALIPRKIK